MFDFTGKRVLVCGGSKGIGRSVAIGFAQAGAAVSICARGAEALAATKAELGAQGHAARCDLSRAEEIAAYIADAEQALGGIDVLINNASGFGATDTEAGWAAGLGVDVMGTVRATHAALPALKASRGCIVNVASISGFGPSMRTPAYAAVKALLINYTQSQAAIYGTDGIRVNGIAPGSIEFPGGSWERRRTEDPKLYNGVLARIPFGRMGTPEEVANVVLFLASPLASWVTGHTVVVDGGQLLN
ncbi:3-oxoacyl-[acyl-carrier protein] reductase [Humitalea rosea]|uniref:3-oxoacyl-[acyl-carrier protein] reductase n=1 Tax=Humitalea rosea TaxID=990373 RepID=A0A2W7IVP7_9PROT|nr:SDR family NAD(P)-dependent oxidoreductase [Humitalea rosea]PZW50838.1 3-oxoacyl-[acyl-carrier protein] reductase [Humitalea rosea]